MSTHNSIGHISTLAGARPCTRVRGASMTVNHTKSPERVQPRPPMSTKVDKVDVDIAHRTGRPRALDALGPGRSHRTYRPSGPDERCVQAQEARCAQAAAYYFRIFRRPGPPLTISQASRLWGLRPSTCSRILEKLIDRGFLKRTSEGNCCRRDIYTPTSAVDLPLKSATRIVRGPRVKTFIRASRR